MSPLGRWRSLRKEQNGVIVHTVPIDPKVFEKSTLQEIAEAEAAGTISHEDAMMLIDVIADKMTRQTPWYRNVLQELFPSMFTETF